VTPEAFDAVTPAAIGETRVAVATIRQKSEFTDVRKEAQYRHIEIFDMSAQEQPLQITQNTRAKADHFNPFVMDGGKYIGYHRCKSDLLKVHIVQTPPIHLQYIVMGIIWGHVMEILFSAAWR
jgi:hypothetical protein